MIHLNEEVGRCLLCENPPCTGACKNGDPARAIRAVRFDNAKNAWRWIAECDDAQLEEAEKACIHYDKPIRIREIASAVREMSADRTETDRALPDLSISFCGIHCKSPFFLASSAICTNYDMVARAFDAGWAGVFYKTICKQEIREVSPRFDAVKNEGAPFVGFRNMEQLSENPYEMDFDILRRLKQNYPDKIVVASVMGQLEEEWIELSKMAEEAGCDAVELNFSCPQMRLSGLGSDVGQNPELVTFYTSYVKRTVSIPVIPKMTPNVANMHSVALASYFAGADGISAINTIKSITMSPDSRVSDKHTVSGYSGKAVKPIALRFIHEIASNTIIYKEGQKQRMEISGIGGVETWRDALEFLQLGCRNVQVCTAVMQYGYRIIDDLILGMQTYMMERGISRLDEIVGEMLPQIVLPSDLDRETMVLPKIDRTKCIGCGRCYISCTDGGHQAITFNEERKPSVIGKKCVGCHLCRLICPTGAIGLARRIPKME